MGSGQSSQKVSAQDRAILDMKIQRDKLQQYQKRVKVITDRETAVARECLARGDKQTALLALRRKKFQTSLLDKTDAQLATLEQLTANIEFALVQKDVMFGLKQGTSVLQQINAEMGGLENVEKMLGENEEAREYQKQVSEMLEGELSRGDEDEVEEELQSLERMLDATSPEAAQEVQQARVPPEGLPNVPEAQPVFAEELRDRARRTAMRRDRKLAEALEPVPA